jgi:alpha-tubulin suppressor-like RCC1 family protein
MPPKTEEQKARAKARAAELKAAKAAAKAGATVDAAKATSAGTSATSKSSDPNDLKVAELSISAPSSGKPNSNPPSTSEAYDNSSSSALLCLPLDPLAYTLTFLSARELGACLIASSYLAKSILPTLQQKVIRSRCKHMLPPRSDNVHDTDVTLLDARTLAQSAVTSGVDLVNKAISKVNKRIVKSQPPNAKNSAPLLSEDPAVATLSLPAYVRFIDEALAGQATVKSPDGPLPLPAIVNGRFVSCSPEHSVIRAGGGGAKGGGSGVMTWGVGKRGQLGLNKREDNPTPSPLYNPIGHRIRIVQVAAGGGLVRVAHTLLLTDAGRVLSFGCAMYGALGHGFSAGSQLPDEIRPRVIEPLVSETVTCIAAGELHSACVTADGDVYTWGEGFCGQLGQSDKRPSLTPGLVADEFEDEIALSVSCGARHTLVLTEDGEMWSFGLGYFGVLGRSFTPFQYGAKNTGIDLVVDEEDAPVDAGVDAPPPPPVLETQTSNGVEGLSKDQEANLDILNITLDDTSDQCRPRKIESMEGVKVVSVSAGHRHNLCLDENGSVYSWGSGGGGGLGHGDNSKLTIPEKIVEMQQVTSDDSTRVISISAGVDASMVVLKNGDVYSWGRTRGGRIGHGDGSGNQVTLPRKVQMGIHEKKAVACDVGYVHSLIVLATGQVLQCGKVGVDDEPDGADEPREGELEARLLPSESVNVWQRNREPVEVKVVEKYKKYGTYTVSGRSAAREDAKKWNPNSVGGDAC